MNNIIIFTKFGKALKVKASDFPLQKRGGMGVKPITLQRWEDIGKDEVVSVVVVEE